MTSPHANSHKVRFDLTRCLSGLKHYLPTQAPIKDFVHHNTLHGFQHLDFEEAVLEASRVFGARAYLPLEEYRNLAQTGKIQEGLVLQEIEKAVPDHILSKRYIDQTFTGRAFVEQALREYLPFPDLQCAKYSLKRELLPVEKYESICKALEALVTEDSFGESYPRSRIIQNTKVDLNRWVHPILFRLVGSYLDQGICLWTFPNRDLEFFPAVVQLIRKSFFPLASYVKKAEVQGYLDLAATVTAERLLDEICPDDGEKEDYLRECLLAHPGWSGMVALLEENPKQLPDSRPIKLVDFLAVKLLLESQALRNAGPNRRGGVGINPEEQRNLDRQKHLGAISRLFLKRGISDSQIKKLTPLEKASLNELVRHLAVNSLASIWHRALENTVYQSAISAISLNSRMNQQIRNPAVPSAVTAVFCIDDRESSLRFYLEEEDSEINTESTAGFFGIDFLFKSLNDAGPVKLCPVPVNPKHVVTEKSRTEGRRVPSRKIVSLTKSFWNESSSSLLLGWLFTPILAPWTFLNLVARIFRPSLMARLFHHLPVQEDSELDFIRDPGRPEPGKPENEGWVQGYTFEEMADRISNQLRSTGLSEQMSPLILMVAHGSSSVNNPHFSAYDCGACSGRPGAANAKTFARMANHPQVRQVLKMRGLTIPETTSFVGVFHDTCKDTFTFFDVPLLDEFHRRLLAKFETAASSALMRNAKERARRFEAVPLTIDRRSAHKEAQHRSSALFEPRPELNHATNALCIVGRRYLTRQLFLDRRAFLQSYDPEVDPTRELLKGILSAVVPVCAGINLEYLFSKVDNEVYGSGTKLPHNVASLLGVMNGVDDDLRTGLPRQMVEIHDPVRCLFVVEQKAAEVEILLKENPSIAQWFEKRWAFLVTLDPDSLSLFQYVPIFGFRSVSAEQAQTPLIANIEAHVSMSRDHLKFGIIAPRQSTTNLGIQVK